MAPGLFNDWDNGLFKEAEMTPKQINELIACKLFGINTRAVYPDYQAYIPHYSEEIYHAFKAVDKLIEMGYRSFRLTYVCCVNFVWAAEIVGPYEEKLRGKPNYGGAGATREEAICSMIVRVLEGQI